MIQKNDEKETKKRKREKPERDTRDISWGDGSGGEGKKTWTLWFEMCTDVYWPITIQFLESEQTSKLFAVLIPHAWLAFSSLHNKIP